MCLLVKLYILNHIRDSVLLVVSSKRWQEQLESYAQFVLL
jgi:hypothetical protein